MATMLYDATLYLAEALCIFGFLHSLPHRSLPVWLRVSVVVLLAVLLALRGGADGLVMNPYGPVRLAELFVLLFGFCLALFDVGATAALYFAVVVFLVEISVERVAAALTLSGFPDRVGRPPLMEDPLAAALFFLAMTGGFGLILLVLKRRFLKVTRPAVAMPEIAAMLVSVVPVVFVDNADEFAGMEGDQDFLLAVHLLCSLVSLTTIVIVAHIVELEVDKAEKRVLEALLSASKGDYERRRAERERLGRAYHDVKRHMRYMAALDDSEERRAYAAGVLESLGEMSPSLLCTGNEALDIVLADYARRCKAAGTRLVLFVEAQSMGFMRPADIVVIVGNVLENALEATSGQEGAEIVVRVRGEGGWLSMHFENTLEAPLSWSGAWPETTKSDEAGAHGLGLKSVDHVARAYGGQARACSHDGRFVVNVLIPIPACEMRATDSTGQSAD